MADGRWQMANGRWQMANGKWQMANGKWQMADGKWQMANGRWQMANGKLGRQRRPTKCETKFSWDFGARSAVAGDFEAVRVPLGDLKFVPELAGIRLVSVIQGVFVLRVCRY